MENQVYLSKDFALCKTDFVVKTKLSLTNGAQCHLKAFLKMIKDQKYKDTWTHYNGFTKDMFAHGVTIDSYACNELNCFVTYW